MQNSRYTYEVRELVTLLLHNWVNVKDRVQSGSLDIESYLGSFLKEQIFVVFFFQISLNFEYLWLKWTFFFSVFLSESASLTKLLNFVGRCWFSWIFWQKPGRFPRIRFLASKPISLAIWKRQLSAIKLDTSSLRRSIFSQDTPWRESFSSGYSGHLNPSAELAGSFAFLMFWQHLLE